MDFVQLVTIKTFTTRIALASEQITNDGSRINPGKVKRSRTKWRRKNRKAYNDYSAAYAVIMLDSVLAKRYGVSEETICAARAAPCEICKATAPIVIDHDPATGKFRGGLCRQCNLALGKVGDTREALQRFIDYLERHDKH
jgi:hypothetical protein